MRRTRAVTAACVAAALVAATPSGASQAHLHPVALGEVDYARPLSDGVRYVAWTMPGLPATTHLEDTKTAQRRDFPSPPCVDAPTQPAYLVDVSAGELLYRCFTHAILYDIADGSARTIAPPGFADLGPWATYAFTAVGAHWVGGYVTSPRITAPGLSEAFFVDRGTDAVVRNPMPTAEQVIDLDEPGLLEGLCPPMRRAAQPGSDEPSPLTYAPPYGIDPTSSGSRPLELQRCGRSPIRVSACRRSCQAPQLTARVLTWSDRSWIHAYFPATGRRARARVAYGSRISAVVHTDRWVYWAVSMGPARVADESVLLWRARLPGRLARLPHSAPTSASSSDATSPSSLTAASAS